ncbi:MAG: hypothetical protein NT162_03730 [Candidatus Woesebacteria bacterium]|nr:hypothetical protein [Candidatus Woesebacteria bacterium]
MIYLVAGKEVLLKNQFIRNELKQKYTVKKIECSGKTEEQILAEVSQGSLFDSNVAYVLYDIDTVKGQKNKFTKWFSSMNPDTPVFLLISKTDWELKKSKTKFYEDVKNTGKFVCFNPLKGNKLVEWAKAMFGNYGKSISQENLTYFLSLMGSDLLRISNEIYKIVYACEGNSVDLNTIKNVALYSRKLETQYLFESIAKKDRTKALFFIIKMLADCEPFYLLAIIKNEFEKILLCKVLSEKRVKDSEISTASSIPLYRIRDYVGLAYQYSVEQIAGIFKKLSSLDTKLKTRSNSQYLFEKWVVEVCC